MIYKCQKIYDVFLRQGESKNISSQLDMYKNWFLQASLLILGAVLIISVIFHFPGIITIHIGSDGGTLIIDGSTTNVKSG